MQKQEDNVNGSAVPTDKKQDSIDKKHQEEVPESSGGRGKGRGGGVGRRDGTGGGKGRGGGGHGGRRKDNG